MLTELTIDKFPKKLKVGATVIDDKLEVFDLWK
jgi:hypothetical protein